jgi:hypothetical protein
MCSCNKEIKEGSFIIQQAIQKTAKGNKKVNLFCVICSQCVETNRLTEKVVGSIKVVDSA